MTTTPNGYAETPEHYHDGASTFPCEVCSPAPETHSLVAQAEARQARVLAQAPEAVHAALRQEARYVQNMVGGRFSEALQMAVNNWRDGTLSDLARSLLPTPASLRHAAAEALAKEFGDDISEWTV
ncbi:MAG TPA: hypothetical protein VEV45_20880 [Streptosporangiaceae bacterium]|nr:hypothetical protein [Streptosporangiaceae bacterium]